MNIDVVKARAREMLTAYLFQSRHRKTHERYAILDAVYDMESHFTIDELSEKLQSNNFRVSRATLYNTLRLFIEMRLVVRHRFIGQTKYEACQMGDNHLHQVCTICGKVAEVEATKITEAISSTHFSRFHQDGFTLYIYGVCSSCQTKLSKQKIEKTKNI